MAIVSLLPDVLGTYADGGNATVLAQRLRWRGIAAEVLEVTAHSTPPRDGDIYLLGGGEDSAQVYAAQWLRSHPRLLASLSHRQVVAVCAGLQILGLWMQGNDGRRHQGAGLLNLTTGPGNARAVGEIMTHASHDAIGPLTGFENHLGRTTLGSGAVPLGWVIRGTGNGDGGEGILTPTVVGTYLHGPVLARNPALADFVLHRATALELAPLTVQDEKAARGLHMRAPPRIAVAGVAGSVRGLLGRRP